MFRKTSNSSDGKGPTEATTSSPSDINKPTETYNPWGPDQGERPEVRTAEFRPGPETAGPFDPGSIKEALGFDRDDPNVTVRQIPMGDFIGKGKPLDIMTEGDNGSKLDGHADSIKKLFGNMPNADPFMESLERAFDRLMGGQPNAKHQAERQEITGVLDVLEEVFDEVRKAQAKHPPMTSPHEGHSVIREEFDELWDEVKADRGRQASARSEAVQLAAMAVRYILDLDPQ